MAEFRNLDFEPGIIQKCGYGLAIETRMTMRVHPYIFILSMASMKVRMAMPIHRSNTPPVALAVSGKIEKAIDSMTQTTRRALAEV